MKRPAAGKVPLFLSLSSLSSAYTHEKKIKKIRVKRKKRRNTYIYLFSRHLVPCWRVNDDVGRKRKEKNSKKIGRFERERERESDKEKKEDEIKLKEEDERIK